MHIYFSGLGGVGMGPLAEIARDAGYHVSGSDIEEGLMTAHLASRGIDVHVGIQDGSFLQQMHDSEPIDWFVYTPAIPEGHPELVLARELGIPTLKRGEYLAHFIEETDLKLIAVSGTHGKTTTTGMMIWTLKQLGIPVSYSIGSTIGFGPSGVYDPESEYFVYECDEFDRNFLYFHPYISIISSVDYDHPDTYPTEDEYKAAFRDFLDQSKMAVLWKNDADFINTRKEDAWYLQDDDIREMRLAGAHNRKNGTLVLKALERLGIGSIENNIEVLESFPGTDRRFEKLAENLYSDYGHHPTEIAATLQLAREVSDHVVLVYQPHQNIRQHEIKDQYTNQFELAEEIYWLPTYLSREDPNLAILTPEELIVNITNKDHVHVADFNDELWQTIETARRDGKLVLGMGAGKIDGWLREQLER
jgi:UDP-N-acetylmuramate--alanine ligase